MVILCYLYRSRLCKWLRMSSVENSVINKILVRQKQGFVKYQTTMDRQDLNRIEWLTHAQEEALDLAIYLEKLIQIEKELMIDES